MLSYKNGETVKPLYDYYVETDLDSLDDQPVDYSKKYADQDSYEVSRRTKSTSSQTVQFPSPPEVSQQSKQTGSDEVRVYCIEGTPVTISSASSLCDLRDLGSSNLQPSRNDVLKKNAERTFPRVCSENTEGFSDVKPGDSLEHQTNLSKQPVKDDNSTKEEKTPTSRDEYDCSKVSTPLMFSRSSSVCSLNSFEQHSITDDRSSVSIFSTLTSGIISPSDLPDSPGELMSPSLQKNKQSQFQFPHSDTQKCDDYSMSSLKIKCNENTTAKSFDGMFDDVLKVYNDEEEFSTTSSLSSLSVHDNSNHMPVSLLQIILSNDSSEVPVNFSSVTCPAENSMKQCSMTSLDIKSNCIKCDKESNCDHSFTTDTNSKLSLPNIDESSSQPEKHNNVTCNLFAGSRKVYENEEISSISSSLGSLSIHSNRDGVCTAFEHPCVGENTELVTKNGIPKPESANELKNISDDTCDKKLSSVLMQCMEESLQKKSIVHIENSEESFIHSLQSLHQPEVQDKDKDLKSPKSGEDSEEDGDENDILVQRCIQLGMPKKLFEGAVDMKIVTSSEYQSHCMSPNENKDVKEEVESVKSGQVSDDDADENDMVQRCIQLGMPKKSFQKSPETKIFASAEYQPQCRDVHDEEHFRDNCPDGVSDDDDDEDDDILAKCIRAGMPSPKLMKASQKRQYASPNTNEQDKLQNQVKSTTTEKVPEYGKKFCTLNKSISADTPQNHSTAHISPTWVTNSSSIDVDSMRIYRTEDTPILSPSASISDLSSLSFNDEKSFHESYLNNSRNSDCSSESEDDELLLQCIRSGMPVAKRAVA